MLVTSRLIAIPLPKIAQNTRYRDFYGSLLESKRFCKTAFGPHLVAKPYADWEVVTIFNRKLVSTWSAHGFGDFALALRPPSVPPPLDPSTTWEYREASPSSPTLDLDSLTWIGYTCLRDAHLTSLKNTKGPSPAVVALLWEELVEVKYGLDEDYWGQGYATEAVGALQEWAVGRFGIRRFVGACIPGNKGSAKVLTKLGYRETENFIYLEYPMREWELVVEPSAPVAESK